MRRSFGLIGMRERAAMLGGEMKIQSQPGVGTSIEIVIPRSADQPQARAGGTDKLTARPEPRL
jgi:two-component system sensor histidine kinase UhpB